MQSIIRVDEAEDSGALPLKMNWGSVAHFADLRDRREVPCRERELSHAISVSSVCASEF